MSEALNQVAERIKISQSEIEVFCRQHHIKKMLLFGSVLRDDFTDESDVDVLVEFEPEYVPTFIGLSAMQRQLVELFQHDVDLNTPGFLSTRFRQEVLNNARVLYEENS